MIEEFKGTPIMCFVLIMILCGFLMAVGVWDNSTRFLVLISYSSPLALGVALLVWGVGQSKRYWVAAILSAGNVVLWLGVLGFIFFVAHRRGYSEVWEAIPSMMVVAGWGILTMFFGMLSLVMKLLKM